MRIKFRTAFWAAAAVVLAVLLALAFSPQAVPVDMAEATSGPMIVTVRDEGRTRVRNEYIVSAPSRIWTPSSTSRRRSPGACCA